MDRENFIKRMAQLNGKYLANDEKSTRQVDYSKVIPPEQEEEVTPPQPVDFYQRVHDVTYASNKKSYPRGAKAEVGRSVETAVSRIVAPKFKVAKSQSEKLFRGGDKGRSQIVKNNYMEETFLPVLEALVHMNSVDELLNAKDAIAELDKYALIEGGRSDGYTASYLRSMYDDQRGAAEAFTDRHTLKALEDVRRLVAANQIRAAIGLATDTLKEIDAGEHSANEDDYNLLVKVAARGE